MRWICFFFLTFPILAKSRIDSLDELKEAHSLYQCRAISVDHLETLLEEVLLSSFPQLTTFQVGLKEGRPSRPRSSPRFFFRSDFSQKQLPPQKRTYWVVYHPAVLDCPPPDLAIRAIMAHELIHIQEYTEWGLFQFLDFSWKYILNNDGFLTQVERTTDLKVLDLFIQSGQRGWAWGLAWYRLWIYEKISERQITQKKRDYLTPEEIAQILD